MNYREEAYLMHYGILGMKWGQRKIRRAENGAKFSRMISNSANKHSSAMMKKAEGKDKSGDFRGALAARKGSKLSSSLAKAADMHSNAMLKKADRIKSDLIKKKKPKISEMSDDELRKRINRMQMEKQYKDLSAGKIANGKKTVSKLLAGSVKTAIGAIVVSETTKAVRKALT